MAAMKTKPGPDHHQSQEERRLALAGPIKTEEPKPSLRGGRSSSSPVTAQVCINGKEYKPYSGGKPLVPWDIKESKSKSEAEFELEYNLLSEEDLEKDLLDLKEMIRKYPRARA